MTLLIKAYDNTDWMSDADFIIVVLSDANLRAIKNIQSIFKRPDLEGIDCYAKFYNVDFEVYTEESILSAFGEAMVEVIQDYGFYDISNINPEAYKSKLVTSEQENDIRLDTDIMTISRDGISFKCYGKYDSSIEIFTDQISI